ncbi:MAG: DUF3667 domain-containing protein [Saprospiraceae bacterium]|nr:DUF3667 domain-containing protein [Saprospiraceae bacterium]
MKRYCRNCFHPLPYKAKFCAHCGQKDTDGKIGMKSLLIRLWNNTFHLEGKFIQTAWQLFIPGKVTVEFFKGKQERYPHPIRLFAIVMFLFLFLLNSMLKEEEAKGNSLFNNGVDLEVKNDTGKVIEKRSIPYYEKIKMGTMLHDIRQDYLELPGEWKTPESRRVVDTLLKSFSRRNGLGDDGLLDTLLNNGLDSIGFGFNGVQIASLDVVRYNADELIERYHITNGFDRLFIRQSIKSYKNPDAFVHACVGSLTWAILALVAMMSGILALLYFRQRRYYVEHFIFLLHFHTGAMLLLLIAITGQRFDLWGSEEVAQAAFLPAPALYFALLRYYGQGWFKTLIKWGLYGIAYLITFIVLFALGMVAVFAFF